MFPCYLILMFLISQNLMEKMMTKVSNETEILESSSSEYDKYRKLSSWSN